MNHKNARIGKLAAAGMSVEQIAKKCGLNGATGIERVQQGIDWLVQHGTLTLPTPKRDDTRRLLRGDVSGDNIGEDHDSPSIDLPDLPRTNGGPRCAQGLSGVLS